MERKDVCGSSTKSWWLQFPCLWSEWRSQSWSVASGGPQNEKFMELNTFKLALGMPWSSPMDFFVSDAMLWGMCSVLMESFWQGCGCFGILGWSITPLEYNCPCFLWRHSWVVPMDLNRRIGSREELLCLPQLCSTLLEWALEFGALTPDCPALYSIPGSAQGQDGWDIQ